MPVRAERCSTPGSACPSSACLVPPAPINTCQPGVTVSLLYSGSQYRGYQRSKGNSYDVEVVLQGKFQAFYEYAKSFNSDHFDYKVLDDSDYIFMRWKEQFLVPDHTIKDISGASFAGFYYICFQKSTATIEGYYYHRSSEWYQSLSLNHIEEHSVPIYEFR
ncbi:glucose-induced degradation protein 4 homolog [Austrofundulus limnaeus]|uniref:Glucose-induced degradation protein 4 homolog n=1 Tax=Austrofundulus limnaeus TaxID=52670 RepID=A0A2I4BRF2_AUSLI|nr:PREDICTED: glucose-induced degradation protein 4 homolog [Austrofundulus limnaeus]